MVLDVDPHGIRDVNLDSVFDAFDDGSVVVVADVDIGGVVEFFTVLGSPVVGWVKVVVLITGIDKIYNSI